MYIQITNRCNMNCEHCCFACGPKGKNMTRETFKQVLELVAESGPEYVTIGGGEPTLHPHFIEFTATLMAMVTEVFVATNGSVTDKALWLANMAKKGYLSAALSQDPYHDHISLEVVDAFTPEPWAKGAFPNDKREIRDVSELGDERMAPFRDLEDGGNAHICPCETVFIRPDGVVQFCGCRDSLVLGHVRDFDMSRYWAMNENGFCYREVREADDNNEDEVEEREA